MSRRRRELVGRLEARGGIDQVERALQEEVEALFGGPPTLDLAAKPSVVLVVGVNGTGKTTTIGKLAMKLREHGRSVLVGAADTFRAAAEEQLEIWAERAGADFVGAPRGEIRPRWRSMPSRPAVRGVATSSSSTLPAACTLRGISWQSSRRSAA